MILSRPATAYGGSMHELLAAGIEFILWIQQFQTPASYRFWEIYTNFGGSYYVYTIPVLLWCVDYRTGLRMLAIFVVTLVLNTLLKDGFAQPRPFQVDERVVSDGEMGYGLPSGHAQLAVVFWGVIASWVDRAGFWWLAVGIMFLMGFSRVVLGVHFPSDVFAGWALGALTLWLYLRYRSDLEAWLGGNPLVRQVGWALGAGALVFFLDLSFAGGHGSFNAGVAGFIAGGGVGAAVGVRSLSFSGHGPAWQRVLRFAVGMLVMLPLMGSMQRLGLPEGGLGRLVLAADLALLGLWLTLGAPWLFEKLRLSGARNAG